ncbi:hypothetical protein ACU8C9_000750 [Campylobacter jejuni]|uniref:hypothetical protein n=1 Tax=Campylobacter jejuni TaxID=197 RepID=UPI000AC91663|nr:hypothetical protein [Campylobacter jejuni]MCW1549695.1 hypothetical protein [Campylobacter jejuni]MCW1552450.1 hypothetical protein [Campylobacter jejuni]MCW1566669.1 hypothetical protein [Campylobacter jejuni]MCW1674287.1 hypothetical protein [Campylobacter jejuni]MED7893600.1 hypothetical protein [Campylobacter jejuni]
MNKTLIFHENSHIDLNASFAPGTYIELQLEKESDKTLNWSYVECNSEKKCDICWMLSVVLLKLKILNL